MKKMNSVLGKSFQPAKCKTQLRLGTSRIKLLRNKKGIQIASDRREVAEFLRNGQESNARLRVEHVIREQDLIEAYDLLFLYAERIAAQLSVIDSQKTCPPELKEDISTLLFASSRCAELPDFAQIRPMFLAKYGKEFVSAAEELRPGCGVNRRVIEKLSVSRASGDAKLKVMKDIAAEHNVEWDPVPFEKEIREVPDDLLDGPTMSTSAETIDDFPTVPNQKPTSRTHLAEPDNFTNLNSGSSMEDKVEPVNSPHPVDVHRTSSQGTRSGPPSRKPPGREQPKTEDLSFDDRHTDMDPGRRETQIRRNSYAPAPQARHQDEESRRNSIGGPREKTGLAHTGSAFAGMDESSPHEYTKDTQRESQAAELDDFDGSHRPDRRQSQKYDQYRSKGQVQETNADPSYTKGSRPVRTSQGEVNHTSDDDEHGVFVNTRPGIYGGRRTQTRQHQDLKEDNYSVVYRKEGSGKSKPREQDQGLDEDYYRSVPSREGSGKPRAQHQDQESDEHSLKIAPSWEGSGKGRPHHVEQGSSRGKRYGSEDPDSLKTSRNSRFENGQVDFDDGPFTSSSRTEKRMSLPGGSVRDKSKYQGNRDSDDSDDIVRPSGLRATIGPEEIRAARPRETEDPPRSRYGEKEKQLDTRRQSAPLPKDDKMERRQSPSYSSQRGRPERNQGNRDSDDYDDIVRPSGRRATVGPEEIRAARPRETEDPPRSRYGEKEKQLDTRRQSAPVPKDDKMERRQSPIYSSQRDRPERHRKVDTSAGYDDERPPRFSNPKVGLDDEYSPNTRAQRDRPDRQRKSDMSPRYDDDKPPPRFIKVDKQPTLDDEKPQRFVNSPRHEPLQRTPRPRSNLHSVKTDPDLSGTPKPSAPEHRKSQSASDGQPQSKPAFMKPPDLDVLIQMFGNKGKKK